MRLTPRDKRILPATALQQSWRADVELKATSALRAMMPGAWLACVSLVSASLLQPLCGVALAAQTTAAEVQDAAPATAVVSTARRVPAVIGLARDQARQRLRDAGFSPLVSVMPGPTGSTGLVITQRPRAGAMLERGRAVAIVVSDTPTDSATAGPVAMPTVVGDMQGAARARLAALGADVIILERRTSIDGEGDRVLAQEPAAGVPIVSGAEVLLTVGRAESLFDSSGARRQVNVPSVVGLSLVDARVRLRAAQLGLGEIMPSDSVPVDSVITAQQPDSGARAETGTLVAVSLQREVPPVRRMPWWIALVLFAAAGTLGAFLRKAPTVHGPSGGQRERYTEVQGSSGELPTVPALEWPPTDAVSAEILSLDGSSTDTPPADAPPPTRRGAPDSD